ncbi:MAG: DUF6328 family protein [Vitreimonas sp.]
MSSLKDSVASELSELRNMVLGTQIFLGFQYEALFMPRFELAAARGSDLYLWGFAALVITLICLIAPTSHHRLAEHGNATTAQSRFAGRCLCAGALMFALGLGANVGFALGVEISTPRIFAIVTTIAAIAAWFVLEFAMRRHEPQPERADQRLSIKETLSELMSESRIVLPGVQALLGFQLAAYLSDGFHHLPQAAQSVHHAALGFLLASMILLMAPAPFHRIAEHGRATRRAETVGVWMVMLGLSLLALALSCDLYVAIDAATQDGQAAGLGAAGALLAALAIWFVYPLLKRAMSHGAQSDETAAQS